MGISTAELVDYLDGYLRIDEYPDDPRALNGLQVRGGGEVRSLVAAVDASEASIRAAVDAGADVLLVHHGLFWGGLRPVTGRLYRRLAPLIDAGVALYSVHIPLDAHPEVGNSAVLARELGVDVEGRFGDYEGAEIGWWGRLGVTRSELAGRLEDRLGRPVHVVPGGPEDVGTAAVVTGAASSLLDEALERGLDAFVTGEGSHHTFFDAREGGINLYYGGHYATETWGVRALARHLEEEFGIAWEFFDDPTGL